jgi:hypothetical protein
LSVPAQDRRRCDQQSESATSGQQSGEGCDQGSVGPADLWPWCASLQHRQLMAQDEDLDVFVVSDRVCSTIQVMSFANI